MVESYRILAVNPGSTSTKIAVFDDEKLVFQTVIRHPSEEINKYNRVSDQFEFRKNVILETLNEQGINLRKFNCVVGRGGVLKPIPGGTYIINEKMLEDLRECRFGEHASNLGAIIAYEIASELNVPAYIVDPVVVDELDDIARISGLPNIQRVSIFHALNQKAIARRAARDLGKSYDEVNFVVAHVGGGISVGAHYRGRVIDVNNALNGEGPFSPERSGGLPVEALARLCFSGEYKLEEVQKMIRGKGGLVAYLGTNDAREVSRRIEEGDKKAELIYKAMAYQVSKEIAACAAVLKGDVDAILITGGIAYDNEFVDWIKERVSFISKVMVYPGEDEMLALAQGGLRVLKGEEEAKVYM